jgi:hypothetical protein
LREAVLATARNGCFSGDMAPLGLLATGQHVQNDGYMSQLAQLGVDVFNCDGDMLVPAWSPVNMQSTLFVRISPTRARAVDLPVNSEKFAHDIKRAMLVLESDIQHLENQKQEVVVQLIALTAGIAHVPVGVTCSFCFFTI